MMDGYYSGVRPQEPTIGQRSASSGLLDDLYNQVTPHGALPSTDSSANNNNSSHPTRTAHDSTGVPAPSQYLGHSQYVGQGQSGSQGQFQGQYESDSRYGYSIGGAERLAVGIDRAAPSSSSLDGLLSSGQNVGDEFYKPQLRHGERVSDLRVPQSTKEYNGGSHGGPPPGAPPPYANVTVSRAEYGVGPLTSSQQHKHTHQQYAPQPQQYPERAHTQHNQQQQHQQQQQQKQQQQQQQYSDSPRGDRRNIGLTADGRPRLGSAGERPFTTPFRARAFTSGSGGRDNAAFAGSDDGSDTGAGGAAGGGVHRYSHDYQQPGRSRGGRRAGGMGQPLYRSSSDLHINASSSRSGNNGRQLSGGRGAVGMPSALGPVLRKAYGSTDVLQKGGGDSSRARLRLTGGKDYSDPHGGGSRVPQLHAAPKALLSLDSGGNSDSSPSNTGARKGKSKGDTVAGKKDGSSGGKKSEPNFLRRLKSNKGESSSAEAVSSEEAGAESQVSGTGKLSVEERRRLKGFIHYDCQSVGFSINDTYRDADFELSKINGESDVSSQEGILVDVDAGYGEGSLGSRGSGGAGDSSSAGTGSGGRGGRAVAAGGARRNSLVDVCPSYRNEIGGEEERNIALTMVTAQRKVKQLLGQGKAGVSAVFRPEMCNGVSVLELSTSQSGPILSENILRHGQFVLENVDRGTSYYRQYFKDYDHHNYFGMDETWGPVVISLKREKVSHMNSLHESRTEEATYLSRVIVRSSQLSVLRGLVHDNVLPTPASSNRHSTTGAKATSHKDIIEFACPGIQTSCLKATVPGEKTKEMVMKVDEQGVSKNYKFGVMLCLQGQSSEEEMYNNEHSTPAFLTFLQLLGQKVRLKDHKQYKGGLDTKSDTTGAHSIFAACSNDFDVMFHVSTMLPFSETNTQQLLRKRHIGNDIVTLIFQEPEAKPFNPATIRSQFQRVFIVVRVNNPGAEKVTYSVSVVRSKDVPAFGPIIPTDGTFESSKEFGDFLLVKLINAENAVHKSDKFIHMAVRTRREYLKELTSSHSSVNYLDSTSRISKLAMAVGTSKKKKSSPLPQVTPNYYTKGAIVWSILLEDFGQSAVVRAYLGISSDTLVVIQQDSREVVFTTQCYTIIGWSPLGNSLRLFYNHGECIYFQADCSEDIKEIVDRLSRITQGCETSEIILRRNGSGQLGFHVHYEGVVSDVERGHAWDVGLRAGSRLVEICKVSTATLTHDQMIDLLRTSSIVSVVVIRPFDNGKPRKGLSERFEDLYTPYPNDTMHVEPTSVKCISVRNSFGTPMAVPFNKQTVISSSEMLPSSSPSVLMVAPLRVPDVKRSSAEPSFSVSTAGGGVGGRYHPTHTHSAPYSGAARAETSGGSSGGGVSGYVNGSGDGAHLAVGGQHERTRSRESVENGLVKDVNDPNPTHWSNQGRGSLDAKSTPSQRLAPARSSFDDMLSTPSHNPPQHRGSIDSTNEQTRLSVQHTSDSSHWLSQTEGVSNDTSHWSDHQASSDHPGSSFDSTLDSKGSGGRVRRHAQFFSSVKRGRDRGAGEGRLESIAARSKSETHLNVVGSHMREGSAQGLHLLNTDSEDNQSELSASLGHGGAMPYNRSQDDWKQLVSAASKAIDGEEAIKLPKDKVVPPAKKVISYGEGAKTRELERKLSHTEDQLTAEKERSTELSSLLARERDQTSELSHLLARERERADELTTSLSREREENARLRSRLEGFTRSFYNALDGREAPM